MRTATRTSTTRTTRSPCELSADIATADAGHAAFSFAELAQAYFDCRQHKRNKSSALTFELNLERNLVQLYKELSAAEYRIGKSICFVITRPKPREVWAADFRDRIVHHLLYNRIAPRFERSFIADSCACIKGRGTLYAAERLEAKIRSASQNWRLRTFYAKADLANFFVSIDKNILFALIEKRIQEPFWLDLAEQILFHDPCQNYQLRGNPDLMARVPEHKRLTAQPAHLGLPIGNLSSQFFANIYLNELDQFAKHTLRAKHYIRYVDDFVLLHDSPQWLNDSISQIDEFLQTNLAARLNPSKTIIQPVERGVDFVGQVIKPWRRTIRKKTKVSAIHRTRTAPANKLHTTANSYFGLLRQATHSHRDRAKLAKQILLRGRSINQSISKTYRSNA